MNDLDAYLKRIQKIKWFTPHIGLNLGGINFKVQDSLRAFDVEAIPEYRSFKTFTDWGAIRDQAWSPEWAQARHKARDFAWVVEGKEREEARDLAWETGFNGANNKMWHEIHHAIGCAAWDMRWAAAWAVAWGAQEVLAQSKGVYQGTGAFLKLVDLYELGVYPMGVIDGKFIVYMN